MQSVSYSIDNGQFSIKYKDITVRTNDDNVVRKTLEGFYGDMFNDYCVRTSPEYVNTLVKDKLLCQTS